MDDRLTECQADGMEAGPLDWAMLGARIRSAALAATVMHRMHESTGTLSAVTDSDGTRDSAGE